jgi:membrane protein implicated in regulation of membrane protease activity
MNPVLSPWLLWFLAGIAIMLGELAIPGFVIIFFGLGCWAAAVVAALSPHAYSIQVAAFLMVSVSSLLMLRKLAMRVFVGRSEGTGGEDMGNVPFGARVSIDQEMTPGRIGRVRFRGAMWDAVSEEPLSAGSDAQIIGVDKDNRSCLKIKAVSHV